MQTANAAPDASVHPMSDYEKFLFDLKGFLVIPGVLTDEEMRAVREHTETLLQDPESLPEHHRAPIAGPAEFLIDHPRVMGLLQAVLAPKREHIRLESVFVSGRSAESDEDPWRPHVGGANLDPSLSYRYHNGRIYSGMTRIVWELNEVKKGQGGYLSGTRLAQSQFGFAPRRDVAQGGGRSRLWGLGDLWLSARQSRRVFRRRAAYRLSLDQPR